MAEHRVIHPALLALLTIVAAFAAPRAQESEPLRPTPPGREVVIDSRAMVAHPNERSLTLSDIDPETAEIVREINRKPGTWQMYLLYTAEDLPERMFHPGFAIRFPSRKQAAAPPDYVSLPPAGEPAPTAAPAPAAATSPAPAPRTAPPK